MLDPTCPDFLTTRRQLINDGNIHFTKGSNGQSPRNGGCRHHQDIRILPFFTKNPPLIDPKTVLLICNHQPQMVILDPLLNQGMGPNDHIHLSQLNSSQSRPPNCHLHPTGQQGNGKLWKKLTQTFIMLFRQNLRWYHQSRLITCCMGCIHGQASNNRLPRPNIPLQKAIHVTRRGHI